MDYKNEHHNLLLFNEDEAINLGNLFKNEYMSYHGFSNYCFNPLNNRQKLLFDVQKYNFCAHEINLYKDTHYKDINLCTLYNEYKEKEKQALMKYESQYGPLDVSDSCINGFNWINGPWPWEYQ